MGKWKDMLQSKGEGIGSKWSEQLLPQEPREEKEIREEAEDLEWREILGQAFQNIPSSAWETGKGLVAPILHPVQTAKSLYGLGMGTAQQVIPGEQRQEQYFDALVDFMKQRYGNVSSLKQTMAKDPVGFLSDIASLFMGGGTAMRGLGVTSGVGKATARMGAALEPLNIATRMATAPLRFLPERVPSKLFQSAAKFSTTLTIKERNTITSTALENAITPTIKGLDKTRRVLDDLNAEIRRRIDLSAVQGNQIPIGRLFRDFAELEKKASLTGRPTLNQQIIRRIRKDILKANAKLKRGKLTPQETQQLKQNIYKDLDTYYSSIKEAPMAVKTQMKVASNARKALEEIIPEIKQLNAEDGALIDLRKALERSTNRITNRDLISLGMTTKGIGGGVLAGLPGASAGLALGILDTPTVKAKIAIVLDRLRRKGIKIRPTRTALRLGLFQTGRMENLFYDPNLGIQFTF